MDRNCRALSTAKPSSTAWPAACWNGISRAFAWLAWAREGVPLGMDQSIPDAGIFPRVEAGDALETKTDMAILHSLRNYDSVEAQLDKAAIEIDQYVKKGFCKVLALEEIHSRFPAGTASRLALILKQKADGSTKRRIVIDMRRSKGNDRRAKIEERIVLPRSQDIVASLRVMRAREHELVCESETRSIVKGSKRHREAEVEFVLLDLKDAFCHFGVHPDELKHCASPIVSRHRQAGSVTAPSC